MVDAKIRSGLLDHPFGADYAARIGALPGAQHAWVDSLRQTARAVLAAKGLPGAKAEAWKFTPLSDLARVPFIPAARGDDIDVPAAPGNVPNVTGAARLVLVNGVPRPDLSDPVADLAGVTVTPLRAALSQADARLKAQLGGLASAGAHAMAALNTTYMADGLLIAAARTDSPARLHVISIGAAGAEPVAFHPRLVVDLAPGAELTLVESHVGLPGQAYFSNWVAEIALGTAARLNRAVLVDEDADAYHASVSVAALASGACYEDFRLSLGGGKVRQDIEVKLGGRHAEAHVAAAYALARRDHHDLTTVIDHAVPQCTSTQEIKGVVAGKAHAVFQGRIHVARDAQKTNATQSHKALFLNAGPAVDCKPELEIFADDVQCAHGAATGEIDPQHLFYLLSRGIDPETARGLLIAGFLEDVTARIADPAIAAAFVARIETWLKTRAAGGGVP